MIYEKSKPGSKNKNRIGLGLNKNIYLTPYKLSYI